MNTILMNTISLDDGKVIIKGGSTGGGGNTGGGGSTPSTPSDGKTRLFITIASEGRMNVPLILQQSVSNGVVVDWGDGSATETFASSLRKH